MYLKPLALIGPLYYIGSCTFNAQIIMNELFGSIIKVIISHFHDLLLYWHVKL